MPPSLDALLRHLPFDLDDVKAANASFASWRNEGRAADKRVVDLWTYCFVWRYLLTKFTRLTHLPQSDFDALVGDVYERVQQKLGSVRVPERYASWLSVLCHHAFISYLRKHKRKGGLEVPLYTDVVAEPAAEYYDVELIQEALIAAIDALPGFLRQVAQLRFIQQKTYQETAAIMQKDVSVVRAYAHKALLRLRKNPRLKALYEDEDMENR